MGSGFHTDTWVYWKDASISSNQDTVWIYDVVIPVPRGITNLAPDDDTDGTLAQNALDPLDPSIRLDTDGAGFSHNLGSPMLLGTACATPHSPYAYDHYAHTRSPH